MEVPECVRHLINVPTRATLGEVVRWLRKLLIQLALCSEFKHQEDPLLVMKVPIQPEDVRVAQVLLNLDLPTYLLLDIVLDDPNISRAGAWYCVLTGVPS